VRAIVAPAWPVLRQSERQWRAADAAALAT
jgi:hypothetical protein